MSSIGGAWFDPYGDDTNWDNGAAQTGTGTPDSPVGLFGGQFASQQAVSATNGGMDWALPGASTDISGDGTGLSPSMSLPLTSGNINGIGVDPSFIFGEENLPTDDPTRITLPIPAASLPAGKSNMYANTGFTTWGGVDMGAHSIEDLKRWGASDDDITALAPVMGLKGDDAKAYLAANGSPAIGAASADAIRQGALADRTAAVEQAYDNSNPPTPFASLPGGVQTAIVDLAYQTPAITTGAAPNFWGDVTGGNWGAAANELNHYYGPGVQPTPHDVQRRKDEAGLIRGALDTQGRLIIPPN